MFQPDALGAYAMALRSQGFTEHDLKLQPKISPAHTLELAPLPVPNQYPNA